MAMAMAMLASDEDLPPCEDARATRCGVYSAWLKKSKSEHARAKWLTGDKNTRYFTIDFDSQLFFYAHSKENKKISAPISFQDILGAERLPPPAKATKRGKQNQSCGFLLRTKERVFELHTNSNGDAAQWVFALNAARDMGLAALSKAQAGLEGTGALTSSEIAQLENQSQSLLLPESEQAQRPQAVGPLPEGLPELPLSPLTIAPPGVCGSARREREEAEVPSSPLLVGTEDLQQQQQQQQQLQQSSPAELSPALGATGDDMPVHQGGEGELLPQPAATEQLQAAVPLQAPLAPLPPLTADLPAAALPPQPSSDMEEDEGSKLTASAVSSAEPPATLETSAKAIIATSLPAPKLLVEDAPPALGEAAEKLAAEATTGAPPVSAAVAADLLQASIACPAPVKPAPKVIKAICPPRPSPKKAPEQVEFKETVAGSSVGEGLTMKEVAPTPESNTSMLPAPVAAMSTAAETAPAITPAGAAERTSLDDVLKAVSGSAPLKQQPKVIKAICPPRPAKMMSDKAAAPAQEVPLVPAPVMAAVAASTSAAVPQALKVQEPAPPAPFQEAPKADLLFDAIKTLAANSAPKPATAAPKVVKAICPPRPAKAAAAPAPEATPAPMPAPPGAEDSTPSAPDSPEKAVEVPELRSTRPGRIGRLPKLAGHLSSPRVQEPVRTLSATESTVAPASCVSTLTSTTNTNMNAGSGLFEQTATPSAFGEVTLSAPLPVEANAGLPASPLHPEAPTSPFPVDPEDQHSDWDEPEVKKIEPKHHVPEMGQVVGAEASGWDDEELPKKEFIPPSGHALTAEPSGWDSDEEPQESGPKVVSMAGDESKGFAMTFDMGDGPRRAAPKHLEARLSKKNSSSKKKKERKEENAGVATEPPARPAAPSFLAPVLAPVRAPLRPNLGAPLPPPASAVQEVEGESTFEEQAAPAAPIAPAALSHSSPSAPDLTVAPAAPPPPLATGPLMQQHAFQQPLQPQPLLQQQAQPLPQPFQQEVQLPASMLSPAPAPAPAPVPAFDSMGFGFGNAFSESSSSTSHHHAANGMMMGHAAATGSSAPSAWTLGPTSVSTAPGAPAAAPSSAPAPLPMDMVGADGRSPMPMAMAMHSYEAATASFPAPEAQDEAVLERPAPPPPPDPMDLLTGMLTPDVLRHNALFQTSGQVPFKGSSGHSFVPQLQCMGCDMQVLQIERHAWAPNVAHLFLRNNYPNVMRLRSHLRSDTAMRAYCCQCSSTSAPNEKGIDDVIMGLPWTFTG